MENNQTFNFRTAALQETTFCPLMVGRTKIKGEELMNQVCTVVAFDFAPALEEKTGQPIVDPDTGEVETYAVLVLKEYPDRFYNGGKIMTGICRVWVGAFEGDAVAASKELEAQGGVSMRFEMKRSRNGARTYVSPTIV